MLGTVVLRRGPVKAGGSAGRAVRAADDQIRAGECQAGDARDRKRIAAAADDRSPRIVAAPDAPVRLESAKVLNTGSDPLVLLYAAKNTSNSPIDNCWRQTSRLP